MSQWLENNIDLHKELANQLAKNRELIKFKWMNLKSGIKIRNVVEIVKKKSA